ncbi:MAG: glucose 1-dehydrogenase [Dehalococcoidia bacterium]|nr:glucose 1-dehydrogenase [Dehalococcoidia bacterium]
MEQRFAGKSACVTGGGSGIGRAAAIAFAAEGARVLIADVDDAGGKETARLIAAHGGEASFLHADVSRAADVQAMVRFSVERYVRLDCAFNNAGIGGGRAPLADVAEETWDRVFAVNAKGVYLCMQQEIQQMLRQGGGGCIVNTASMAVFLASVETAVYTAAKWAVASLTRSAAKTYVDKGIRINAVCPGRTDTPLMYRGRPGVPPDQVLRQANDATPMGRVASVEEVAQAVLWLCSDAASYTAGHLLTVDGGQYL